MNKPAQKEPSMDEILSSIRQIIADDDAAVSARPAPAANSAKPAVAAGAAPIATRGATVGAAVPPATAKPIGTWQRTSASVAEAYEKPLALSAEQIVPSDPKPARPKTFAEIIDADGDAEPPRRNFDVKAELVDPDDVAFVDDTSETPAEPANAGLTPSKPRPEARPASVSAAAPMPDQKLSSDMAEQLLEPATRAAIRGNLHKLSSLTSVGNGVTVEEMMRDMLRPMLKEWLDEHLPAVVERVVEKEIARISRGVE